MFSSEGEFLRNLARARSGEADTLWRLLACSRRYLLYLAHRKLPERLRAKADPADLVEESLLAAHRGFAQFRGNSTSDWFLWLRQTLLNKILNFSRQYLGTARRDVRREVSFDQLAATKRTLRHVNHWFMARTVTPSYEVMALERLHAISTAIGRLPKEDQHLLRLRHHDGLKFQQIGKVLGCTADSARRHWAQVICQLTQQL